MNRAAISLLFLVGVGGCNLEDPKDAWCNTVRDFGAVLREIDSDELTAPEATLVTEFRPRLREGSDDLGIIGHKDIDVAIEWSQAARQLDGAQTFEERRRAWDRFRTSVGSIEEYSFTRACLGAPFGPDYGNVS